MRTLWLPVTCLLALAGSLGCDPIGRGLVTEPVPEPQLVKSQHPTHNIYWTRALGPAAGGDFRCVAVADLDDDGLPDVAAGGFDRRGIRVWLANGDGTWSSIDGPRHLGLPTGLAAGDIDGDGHIDVVVSGTGEIPGVRLWRNTLHSKEDWTEGEHPTITHYYNAVQLHDLNHDGHLDVIAARERNGGGGGIGVWLNREGRSWSRDVGPRSSHTYHDIALADFNRDGHLDIVGARWGNPGGLDIWYGNSRGAWSRAGEDPAFRFNFQGVDTGDFNGDGEVDLVATSYRSDLGVCVLLNDRVRAFQSEDPAEKHREAGWWTTPVPLAQEGSFWDAKALDLNGDGLLDVVATSFDGRGVRVWLQLPREKAEATFHVPRFLEQSFRFPHKGVYYALDSADFNTDERPDLVAVTRDEGVKAWFQTPDAAGGVTVSPKAKKVRADFPAPLGGEIDEAPQDPRENGVFVTLTRDDGRIYTEYRIGIGDQLKIEIYEGRVAEPIVIEKQVEPSGELLIPLVRQEPLRIVDKDGRGLSPSQLRGLIRNELQASVLKNPSVAVVVTRFVAHEASVFGEIREKVNQSQTGQGRYILTGKTRVLDFIAKHGGFTNRADRTKVEIRRRDGEKRVVNLFKAVFQSKLSQDIVLDDGDVITIPSTAMSDRKVYVLGEIRDPGVYELQDKVTVLEAIQLANSFTDRANRKQIIVIRGDKADPTLYQININDVLNKGDLSKNLLLEDGDIVFVPRNWIGNLRQFYAWFLPGFNALTR
jgi:protein involved in polysaccharide export with SLBB domain